MRELQRPGPERAAQPLRAVAERVWEVVVPGPRVGPSSRARKREPRRAERAWRAAVQPCSVAAVCRDVQRRAAPASPVAGPGRQPWEASQEAQEQRPSAAAALAWLPAADSARRPAAGAVAAIRHRAFAQQRKLLWRPSRSTAHSWRAQFSRSRVAWSFPPRARVHGRGECRSSTILRAQSHKLRGSRCVPAWAVTQCITVTCATAPTPDSRKHLLCHCVLLPDLLRSERIQCVRYPRASRG